MAAHAVAAGKIASHDNVLVANVVDTVTFADECDEVEVLSDGTAAIYFSVDGSPATVGGSNCFKLNAVPGSLKVTVPMSGPTSVSLISPGTPTYSVTRTDAKDPWAAGHTG